MRRMTLDDPAAVELSGRRCRVSVDSPVAIRSSVGMVIWMWGLVVEDVVGVVLGMWVGEVMGKGEAMGRKRNSSCSAWGG